MHSVVCWHCGHWGQPRAEQASLGQDVERYTPVQSSHPPQGKPLDTAPKHMQEFLASGTQLWFKTCKCIQIPSFWSKSYHETKTQGKTLILIHINTWWKWTQYFPFLFGINSNTTANASRWIKPDKNFYFCHSHKHSYSSSTLTRLSSQLQPVLAGREMITSCASQSKAKYLSSHQ